MPTHNGSVDPIPSAAEVMARFGKEVLNEKNLSVVDEIAAEDFVELDPIPGQPPGRDGLKTFLSTVLFPAFPGQAMGDRRASQRRRQGRVTVHFVWHTPRHLHGNPGDGSPDRREGRCH
jgi:hypothetical protein